MGALGTKYCWQCWFWFLLIYSYSFLKLGIHSNITFFLTSSIPSPFMICQSCQSVGTWDSSSFYISLYSILEGSIVNVTSVPLPWTESISMSPLSYIIIFLQMLRPSPEPCLFNPWLSIPFPKSLKRFLLSPSLIPLPVSLILN